MSATAAGHVAVAWIGRDRSAPQLADVCHHLEHAFLTEVRLGALAEPPRRRLRRPPRAVRVDPRSSSGSRRGCRRAPAASSAVTDQDLCIVVLTYVFGEAQVGGPAAVVSTARLQQGPAGDPAPAPLSRARLVKECVHEIGHTFGLTHCRTRGCVMGRANTIHDVDAKGDALCRECRIVLAAQQAKEAANVP